MAMCHIHLQVQLCQSLGHNPYLSFVEEIYFKVKEMTYKLPGSHKSILLSLILMDMYGKDKSCINTDSSQLSTEIHI